MSLTYPHAVCAGPLIHDTVQQVIQPHAGHHLRLVTLDLGPCHTWAQNNHRPESGASVEEQQPRSTELGKRRPEARLADSRALQTRRFPVNGSPEELEAYRPGYQLTSHDKWVEQKLTEGRRLG